MALVLFLVIAAGLVLLLWGVLIFNQLVTLKHNVGRAWANIDVLLKQRHDELPKLVDACREYMRYEQETLERVMVARGRVAQAQAQRDMEALGHAEGELRAGLGRLFALAEAYPDLKASETFRHLQSRISGLEEAIADRREFYNEAVNVNNIRIEQFPDRIIAQGFGFKPFTLLAFSTEEKSDVSIKGLFQGG